MEQAYLDTFRSAVYLAKHAGHVLVISGVLLAVTGSWSWTTPWIVMTVFILLASLFFWHVHFSPTIRKFGETGEDKEALVQKAPSLRLDLSHFADDNALVYGYETYVMVVRHLF
ncbi:hypothetical protein GCM10020331_089810 [Ectobacillus funiculus]